MRQSNPTKTDRKMRNGVDETIEAVVMGLKTEWSTKSKFTVQEQNL